METVVMTMLAIASVIFIVYIVRLYNELVQVQTNISKSWANIDVLAKQRYDEIPNLVRVCNAYMKYESETLEKLTRARAQFLEAKTPPEIADADSRLAGGLKTLFAVAENYPALKAEENFRRLQTRITALECAIADRRELYNDSVAVFNTRIMQIPYVLLTELMGYRSQEMYQVAEEETKLSEVRFPAP